MPRYEEFFEDGVNGDDGEQAQLKKQTDEKIKAVQNFLKGYKASRWRFVFVGFGEQLIKDKNQRYYPKNESWSIAQMELKKGRNYGSHEFSYDHLAVILSEIHNKYTFKLEKIVVAPIVTRPRRNSVKLEAQYHRFLEYDSYIDLESIQHISLERIKISESKRRLLRGQTQLPIASPVAITETKRGLGEMFDL